LNIFALAAVIEYEFPINEKVRTMMRLEGLFARMAHFTSRDHCMDHHAALITLFEILEVASRADLKSELLQELERQKRALSVLHNNPDVVEDALDAVLADIDSVYAGLHSTAGKIGQSLRENEWLMGIKQRASIPGGTCGFDLPSYHYWLQQDAGLRRRDLEGWKAPLMPIFAGLKIILRLIRESGKTYQFTAHHGAFQQMQGGRVAQMLRISLKDELACTPEVSANKYALNIRFIVADYAAKSTLAGFDVPFDLTFCSLSA
jgi:cell division protein ZapD